MVLNVKSRLIEIDPIWPIAGRVRHLLPVPNSRRGVTRATIWPSVSAYGYLSEALRELRKNSYSWAQVHFDAFIWGTDSLGSGHSALAGSGSSDDNPHQTDTCCQPGGIPEDPGDV